MHQKWNKIFPLKKWFSLLNIRLNKNYGQNFLLDTNITNKIVHLAQLNKEDIVLEVGGGLGTLTMSLLDTCIKKIYLVEIDEKLSLILNEIQRIDNRLTVIYQDILKTNIPQDITTVVANLPYNISVKFLISLITATNINNITVLLQKEVVDRIVSTHSSKNYGRISILFQIFFICQRVYNLPPNVFLPPPKVDSSLLKMKRQNIDKLHLLPILEELMDVFKYRRKYAHKFIKHTYLLPYVFNKRCEDISVKDFLFFAEMIYKNKHNA